MHIISNSSTCMGSNDIENIILQTVLTTFASLSIFGTLVVILCYILFNGLKEIHHRVIFNMTFTDMFR